MNRAAILIGVQKAGKLPQLRAVFDCVRGMKQWAEDQNFLVVETFTDEPDPAKPDQIVSVEPGPIYEAVQRCVNRMDLDQLIIYFAGHGVNVARQEFWLLSGAPDNPAATVNVTASEARARSSTIPHVIFVSDACRTAAAGTIEQGILGTSIFSNRVTGGPEQAVDLFFATLLGNPALEIAEADPTSDKFNAVYTTTLLEALRGQNPEIVDRGDDEQGRVRPWPLKRYLTKVVPIRVSKLAKGRTQTPDARLSSDPETAWISAVTLPEAPVEFGPPGQCNPFESMAVADNFALIPAGVRSILNNDRATVDDLRRLPKPDSVEQSNLQENALAMAVPFGTLHLETNCGFKIRGDAVMATAMTAANFGWTVEQYKDPSLFAVTPGQGSCASVLLTLQDGRGVLLPAIRDFLATVTFDQGTLADVSYEPSEYCDRWSIYRERADELRTLRAVVAASSRQGRFQLDDAQDADNLARRMQVSKWLDPSLALYAAQAYRDMGQRERIRQMADYLQSDFGFRLFDVALLAGLFAESDVWPTVCPSLPLLSQSWALLSAYDVSLPAALDGIQRHVSPVSLWTLYDPAGVEMISRFLQTGGLR